MQHSKGPWSSKHILFNPYAYSDGVQTAVVNVCSFKTKKKKIIHSNVTSANFLNLSNCWHPPWNNGKIQLQHTNPTNHSSKERRRDAASTEFMHSLDEFCSHPLHIVHTLWTHQAVTKQLEKKFCFLWNGEPNQTLNHDLMMHETTLWRTYCLILVKYSK